jgi:hypothetical protein
MNTQRNRQRGQALVLYTIALVAMMGAAGLAVDVGWMYFREQAAQTAAEAAVMAAAAAAKTSSPAGFTCGAHGVACQAATACPDPIPNPATNNLHNGCLYAKDNGFQATAGGKQNVLMAANTNSPPTVGGVAVAYWVSATVTENVAQTFSSVLGNRWGTVSARATAAVLPGNGGGCIYVLQNTGTTVSNSGNAVIQTGCGVYVDSSSSSAVSLSGNATIRTTGDARTYIVGNWSGSGTITPAPMTGVARTPDPFAVVSPPSVGACTSNGVSLSGYQAATLNPGVYCGAISLSGYASVRFNPGLYVLKGGISMSGQTTIQGTGVTFYLQTGGISLSGGTTVTLSPPTSGMWKGFTIFQDRANTSSMNLSGGSAQSISGVLYAAGANLSFSGNGNVNSDAMTLVCKTLSFSGNAYIASASYTAYTGTLGTVALIE